MHKMIPVTMASGYDKEMISAKLYESQLGNTNYPTVFITVIVELMTQTTKCE